jgi:hypothetical protein
MTANNTLATIPRLQAGLMAGLVLLLLAPGAAAQGPGSYFVPADGGGVRSALTTSSSAWYVFVVSGTFEYGAGRMHDACYALDTGELSPVFQVNGVTVTEFECPTRNANHVYLFLHQGDGSNFYMSIHDTHYADNFGGLSVAVAA